MAAHAPWSLEGGWCPTRMTLVRTNFARGWRQPSARLVRLVPGAMGACARLQRLARAHAPCLDLTHCARVRRAHLSWAPAALARHRPRWRHSPSPLSRARQSRCRGAMSARPGRWCARCTTAPTPATSCSIARTTDAAGARACVVACTCDAVFGAAAVARHGCDAGRSEAGRQAPRSRLPFVLSCRGAPICARVRRLTRVGAAVAPLLLPHSFL
jgi:hypothetical protein